MTSLHCQQHKVDGQGIDLVRMTRANSLEIKCSLQVFQSLIP